MREDDISMHENEDFAGKKSWDDFFSPEMFMENWAVHYFMQGILIHENFGREIFI